MKHIILSICALLIGQNAFAYSQGKINCQIEMFSKKDSAKAYFLPAFEFDVMEPHFASFSHDLLDRSIHMSYTPGLVGLKDVRVFVLDMMYDNANSGADVPAMPNATYTVKVGRQDSDLIGAFMTCKVIGLK